MEPQAQQPTLWLALVLGMAAYMVQGKGYPYQRYSLLAFLLVLIAIDLDALIRKPGVLRWASAAAFAAAAIGIGLPSAVMASQYGRQEAFQHSLEADLTRIASHEPAVRLNHGVQCLDSISGCTNALYEMRLVQSTGQLTTSSCFIAREFRQSMHRVRNSG